MQSIERLFGQAHQARKDGQYAEARASLDTLILIARRHADHILRAHALTAKAQVECDAGNAAAAVPLFEEAVALYRNTSDVLALAAALRQLGDAYQVREDFDEASSRYEEALAIYHAVEDEAPDTVPASDGAIRVDAGRLKEALAQCRRGWNTVPSLS